jgi:adenylate kinase family enzyme
MRGEARSDGGPAVHVTGASGAGTSTLGRAIAARLAAVHLDTDDFYWSPIEPRFSAKREAAERLALLREAIGAAGDRGFVLSGSIGTWGDPIRPFFRHVIFLTAPTAVRLARLQQREAQVFGAEALAPGGARHGLYKAFMEWAADYDAGSKAGRSRDGHEAWLERLRCPVLRLDGTAPIEELAERSHAWIGAVG